MKKIDDLESLEILPASSDRLKAKLCQIIEESDQLSVVIKQVIRDTGFFKIDLEGIIKFESLQ
jgi:hypothetical protein